MKLMALSQYIKLDKLIEVHLSCSVQLHITIKIVLLLITITSAWYMPQNRSVQAVTSQNDGYDIEAEVLKRQRRSCFSHGKILNFRNALRKTNMKLTYKQMAQLIHNHAICVNGICIACGENYVYRIEKQQKANYTFYCYI